MAVAAQDELRVVNPATLEVIGSVRTTDAFPGALASLVRRYWR
jgi:hypothetical protein